MLAYCTALGLPEGWLVYAQGTAPPTPQRVVNTSIDIVPYWFDLAVRPADLLQQVRELAAQAVSQEQDRLLRPA